MALVTKKFYELVNWTLTELPDPRSNNLFLASSVLYPISIIGLYFYFVLSWGPKFMKSRKAYNLDKLLVVYNALQVIACLYIAIEGSRAVLFAYDWRCAAVDYSRSADALRMVFLAYLYYLIKIIDLLDTVFFILRKKVRQATFLHLYHHFGMIAVGWIGIRYLPGGHSAYLGIINCFVHAVMYFYYLLTAYDKEYKKSIWWKKHITQLQLASITTLFTYDWRCAAVDYSNNKEALFVFNLAYMYYLIKIIDLLDTIFFILRKKEGQVSFLHIYHHFGMVAIAWIGIRYLGGGHSVYLGIINCFVHAIMYFYYLLTAYDKEYKKSIWWKKHITQLQLAQFITFFFLYGQLIFRKNCKFPAITQVFFIPQVSVITVLFADFYYKTYIKKPKTGQMHVKSETRAKSE